MALLVWVTTAESTSKAGGKNIFLMAMEVITLLEIKRQPTTLVMMMIMRMEMEMEMAANSSKTTYNTGGSTGKGRSCRREVEGEETAGQKNIQDLQNINVFTNSNSE